MCNKAYSKELFPISNGTKFASLSLLKMPYTAYKRYAAVNCMPNQLMARKRNI